MYLVFHIKWGLLRALLAIALCLPASGQWSRVVFSGKGESTDVPAAHSLGYFTRSPVLRDDGEDLCALCTEEGRAKSALKYSIRPMVRPVGNLAGYPIVDVLYSVTKRADPSSNDAKWKSILVQVGPDRYREIFHLQAFYSTISIKPSSIVASGSERVLATVDLDGGNAGGCWEGYWWFDGAGPHALDFSRLEAAMLGQVPKNTNFNVHCTNLDLKSQSVRSGVQKAHPECHACDWVGEVTAKFRLAGAIAEPVEITFKQSDP